MTLSNHPAFVVIAAALAAPLLAQTRLGARVPVIVLEVLIGILVGPHVLGLISRHDFCRR